MTPDEHRAEAERLLAQADELQAALEDGVYKGEIPEAEAMQQYPEVTMLATLSQAHTLLSWRGLPPDAALA
jgi:hypothetical protein